MGEKQSKIDLERELENILKTKRRYFWDKGPLDHRRDKYIIIERVLEFGTEVEVDVIQNYFGSKATEKDYIEYLKSLETEQGPGIIQVEDLMALLSNYSD